MATPPVMTAAQSGSYVGPGLLLVAGVGLLILMVHTLLTSRTTNHGRTLAARVVGIVIALGFVVVGLVSLVQKDQRGKRKPGGSTQLRAADRDAQERSTRRVGVERDC